MLFSFRLWLNTAGSAATGNALKTALAACGRQDIIEQCVLSLSDVTEQETEKDKVVM